MIRFSFIGFENIWTPSEPETFLQTKSFSKIENPSLSLSSSLCFVTSGN